MPMSGSPLNDQLGNSRQSNTTSRGSLGKPRLRSPCRARPPVQLVRATILMNQDFSKGLRQKSAVSKLLPKALLSPIRSSVRSDSPRNYPASLHTAHTSHVNLKFAA